MHDDVFDLLTRHRAAYCVMSGAGLPCLLQATAPWVYVQLHGPDPHHLYGGSYPEADLCWWADRVREWAAMGKDVFVYFNNDGEVTRSATRLPYAACSEPDRTIGSQFGDYVSSPRGERVDRWRDNG